MAQGALIMLVLHCDWREEPDAEIIFNILLSRMGTAAEKYQNSELVYQIFPDMEGGVGLFCDDSMEEYKNSIQDTTPRWDTGGWYLDQ